MYKIEYNKRVVKELEHLPKREQLLLIEKIEELKKDPRPHGVKTLKGEYAGYLRIRVGNYRVIYEIIDKKLVILVLKIADRKEVYR
jgi:mRNA interferase RelE/StbE